MAGKPQRRAQEPVRVPVQAPADPRPVKYRMADMEGMSSEIVAALKADLLVQLRLTARMAFSAERVGVTRQVAETWLNDDPRFREDADHATQARVDEIELDLQGSTNRSGGDVTARIFTVKGFRPEKYQERIVQATYQHGVYEPSVKFTILEEVSKPEEDPASPKLPAPETH